MTYYEEFGIRQDASVEDIRQAYRRLVRLLHPDGQVDPALKPMAERQMQRLGEVLTILLDPGKRSQYDDALLLGNRLQVLGRDRRVPVPMPAQCWDGGNSMAGFALRYWFWILIAIFVMVLGAWRFIESNPSALDTGLPGSSLQSDSAFDNRTPQPVHKAGSTKRNITQGIAKASPIVPPYGVPVVEKTKAAIIEPPGLYSGPELEDIPPNLFFVPDALVESLKTPPQSLPPLVRESSFAGRWLYSPQAGDEVEAGIYPAMYVELVLAEHDGQLAGDYRARYKVPDRALSPEVRFRIRVVEGSETSAKCAWLTSDNAKGEAEMNLRAPNVLYVTWWTTRFGRQATLGSGAAVLIRQEAP